jgi:hypothetical protein
MSASYDEEQPTDLDRARGLLGDTTVEPETSALHSDEHIEAVLTREGYALGVAFLADELVTRIGQQPVRIADDGSSIDFSARIPAWQSLATRMRAVAAAATAAAAAPTSAPSSGAVCTSVGW